MNLAGAWRPIWFSGNNRTDSLHKVRVYPILLPSPGKRGLYMVPDMQLGRRRGQTVAVTNNKCLKSVFRIRFDSGMGSVARVEGEKD